MRGRKTKRGLRRLLGACLVAAAAMAGCEDPVAALTGLTATSSAPRGQNPGSDGHTHRVTVPLGDIESPPPGGRAYATTTAGTSPHAHTVTLTDAQLTDLQQNGAVVSVATSNDQDHFHVFLLER